MKKRSNDITIKVKIKGDRIFVINRLFGKIQKRLCFDFLIQDYLNHKPTANDSFNRVDFMRKQYALNHMDSMSCLDAIILDETISQVNKALLQANLNK